MKIIYYDSGKATNINTSKLDTEKIFTEVKELCSNTTEIMRVYISKERIEQLKEDEKGLEIVLEKEIEINSPVTGKYTVKKIFFPLSGDFIGNAESPVITVFLGKDKYYASALRNKNGYGKLKNLEKVILGK